VTIRCRYFAVARELVGTPVETYDFDGTLGSFVEFLMQHHGDGFTKLLSHSAIWVNGETVDRQTRLQEGDEVAILPPVSGG
jgi:MoaD family protein